MAKFLVVAVVILIVAVCYAEPPRTNRRLRNRSRFFARQEIAEDIPSQTPYPAAGDVPDVAFDLPADESSLFGGKALNGAPDQTYGPPETEGVPVEGQEDFGVEPESQRFTAIRGNSRFIKQRRAPKAAPLRRAAPLVTAPQLQYVQPQQQLLQQQIQPQQLQLQQQIQPQQLQLQQQQQILQQQIQPQQILQQQIQPQQQILQQQIQPQQLQQQQILQQQQLLSQPILLADGRIVYSILQ